MYQFIIPNKKLFTYQILAYGIVLLNILGLLMYNYNIGSRSFNVLPIAVTAAIIIVWDIYRYKTKGILQSLGILIILCALFWITRNTYVTILNLLLWGLYAISRRKLKILVEPTQISYPSFPTKKINWSDVNNIILKDDMLTIDLKNNKLYQHLIEYADKDVIESEFNDFCKKQIAS